jgi:hypothetical protein
LQKHLLAEREREIRYKNRLALLGGQHLGRLPGDGQLQPGHCQGEDVQVSVSTFPTRKKTIL